MSLDLYEELTQLVTAFDQQGIEYAAGREQDLADIRRLEELDR